MDQKPGLAWRVSEMERRRGKQLFCVVVQRDYISGILSGMTVGMNSSAYKRELELELELNGYGRADEERWRERERDGMSRSKNH
jgi:hypothetical protein